ncbi:hypothetical protein KFE98_09080 [bacterium SCSIO 12741]|nr:hypothetical protein KFE98_09080 [bacterium SCSIO 12741]
MKRLILPLFFLAGIGFFTSCERSAEKAVNNPPNADPIETTTPDTLYAFARPLDNAKFLDHTWVMNYNPNSVCPPDTSNGKKYWYCWGVCHKTGDADPSSRLLGSPEGNLVMAICITTPNDSTSNVDAHGGITSFYAHYGVCHQVANRTLMASATDSTPPFTVSAAKGYWLSHLLYGTYGGKSASAWNDRVANCSAESINVEARMAAYDQDFSQNKMKSLLGDDFSEEKMNGFNRVRDNIRNQKDALAEEVIAGNMSVLEFANAVNQLVNDSLPTLEMILGNESFKNLYNLESSAPTMVIDTALAAREDALR